MIFFQSISLYTYIHDYYNMIQINSIIDDGQANSIKLR